MQQGTQRNGEQIFCCDVHLLSAFAQDICSKQLAKLCVWAGKTAKPGGTGWASRSYGGLHVEAFGPQLWLYNKPVMRSTVPV